MGNKNLFIHLIALSSQSLSTSRATFIRSTTGSFFVIVNQAHIVLLLFDLTIRNLVLNNACAPDPNRGYWQRWQNSCTKIGSHSCFGFPIAIDNFGTGN